MSPRLRPLLLSPMSTEKRKKETEYDDEMEISACYFRGTKYPVTDISSPNSTSYPSRGRLICPSSSSSQDSHYSRTFCIGSPSSQSYIGTKTSRSSLPDVQEEELEEKTEPSEDGESSDYCLCDVKICPHRNSLNLQSSICSQDCDQPEPAQEIEYDLSDGFFNQGDVTTSSKFKKRRIGDTPLLGFATRLGTKFPIFSRKWRSKSNAKSASAAPEVSHASRGVDHLEYFSISPNSNGEKNDWIFSPNVNTKKANSYDRAREEATSTPLLPPLMTEASANLNQVPKQSPLQSPSVAEGNCFFPGCMTLMDVSHSAPHLSTQQPQTSFPVPRPALCLSSEAPPNYIAGPNEHWENKLGHANFTIFPEPYMPLIHDMYSCRRLRADWNLARRNYRRYNNYTGETFGRNSKTHQYTEDKWDYVESIWKRNYELTVSNMIRTGPRKFPYDAGDPLAKIPSLTDLRNGNKFQLLSDEEIVGPMAQAAATLRRNPTRKDRVIKFLTSKFSFPK